MKLNLGCGEDIRHNYINIDLKSNNSCPKEIYRQGDIQSLDWICANGDVEEILALDVLSYIPITHMLSMFKNWAQKLSKGGILKISTPDAFTLAKMLVQDAIQLKDFSLTLFGLYEQNDIKKSAIDAKTLLTFLTECKLEIITKKYNGVFFYVEAKKC